ncbi:small multi-drug export protein [Schnuerera sp. xch1]|nr:small multi-drug export protein [Schnuerera sp. xch1]
MALPIIELRGVIPVGMTMRMVSIHATIISFIDSMLLVPILLFGIRPVFNYLRRTKLFRNIVDKLTNRSMEKGHNVKKYGF